MSHGCNKEMPGKLIMIRKKIQENINTINLKSRKWVKIQKKKVRRYKSKKVTEGTDKKITVRTVFRGVTQHRNKNHNNQREAYFPIWLLLPKDIHYYLRR